MTEKKKLPEQTALYHYRVRSTHRHEVPHHVSRAREASHLRQRVVTVPQADPTVAFHDFAQRQTSYRRARALPQRRDVLVARTFAQTGTPAGSGRSTRLQAMYRALPPTPRSPIPTRSGKLRARRGFFARLLGIFALGVVIVLATNLVFSSSTFRITKVNIVGTHNTTLVHAIEHIGMQGQNIFLLNVPSVQEHVSTQPLVASVEVSRQLPNQLNIAIIERIPVLLWQTSQGTYSVDSQGIIMAPANQTAGADNLLTIVDQSVHGKGSQPLHIGGQLNKDTIAFALDVAQRLPEIVGMNKFQLYYDGTMYTNTTVQSTGKSGDRGSYIVESTTGWKAYLGNSLDTNPLDNRLIELQAILDLGKKQQLNIATIDLRYALHPVFTLQK